MPASVLRAAPSGSTTGASAWLALGVSLGGVAAAATIGGLFTSAGLGAWYDTLAKPSWTPPGNVIGTVWTFLYASMGLAAWLVWRRGEGRPLRLALTLFGAQLALNVLWSALFFGARSPGAAFAEIVLLWIAVLATLVAFWRISRPAGALLVPYLGWVAFAGFLNLRIWQLNG